MHKNTFLLFPNVPELFGGLMCWHLFFFSLPSLKRHLHRVRLHNFLTRSTCDFRRTISDERFQTLDSGRQFARKIESIQEDTERDYSQRKYGKNALVVGDGDDGEILGDADSKRRWKIKW